MTSFDSVRESVAAWPNALAQAEWSGVHGRLTAAISQAASTPDQVGPGDLLSLTRQALLHEQLVQGGCPPLKVPSVRPWPTASEWLGAGLEVAQSPNAIHLSHVKTWRPDWVIGDSSSVDLAVSAPGGIRVGGDRVLSRARQLPTYPADPFLTDLAGISEYTTVGQREAIRAVVTAPPGSTVYVVLPTGAGKSLVAAAPSVLSSSATTVVVVPTVALALDQERQWSQLLGGRIELPRELAYIGERPKSEKESIRARLASGHQRIVFTSPEAAVDGLDGSLYALAGRGGLSHLVIDEAHLVGAWGDSFRPDFQQLPGLRLDLLRECQIGGHERFRTVLMTATMTSDSLELLDTLFAGTPNIYVSSVYIRPEPRYLLGPCETTEQRWARLVEAVTQLPRPMIVYATRRKDAETLARRLRSEGFQRVASFHGDTPLKERDRVLDQWRGSSGAPTLDVVAATSAFGLGVDLQDVRSIVHACIPESVDRFYQEVGRSGRDGHTSVSLFMPCHAVDMPIAADISQRQLIGGQKGFERWRTMIERAESLGAGRFRLDTGELPRHLDDPSQKNRYWNLNTLTQMARAGLISLETEPPPRRAEHEPPEDWEARRQRAYDQYRRSAVVRILTARTLRTEAGWEEMTAPLRRRTHEHDAAGLAAIGVIERAGRCWIDTFRETYRVASHTRLADGTPVASIPIGMCIGCPYCQPVARQQPPQMPATVEPAPQPFHANPQLERALQEQLGQSRVLTVLVAISDPIDWKRSVLRALAGCVRNGIIRVVIPSPILSRMDLKDLHRQARDGFVFVDDDIGTPPNFSLPTVVVHSPERRTLLPASYYRLGTRDAPTVLVVPSDSLDPDRPSLPVRDLRMPSIDINRFLRLV